MRNLTQREKAEGYFCDVPSEQVIDISACFVKKSRIVLFLDADTLLVVHEGRSYLLTRQTAEKAVWDKMRALVSEKFIVMSMPASHTVQNPAPEA